MEAVDILRILFRSICMFSVLLRVVLSSELKNVTACYGNLLHFNCSASEKIVIRQLYFMARPENDTDCKASITNLTQQHCCTLDDTDCQINVFETVDNEVNYVHILQECTGQHTCRKNSGWAVTRRNCDTTYLQYTNYMFSRYDCISEEIILTNNSNSQLKDIEVHIQSGAYPNVSQSSEVWNCSMETECGATVVVAAIDVNLTCNAGTIDCSENNKYQNIQLHESPNHFLLFDVKVDAGYKLWIQVNANDSVSEIDVRCGENRVPAAFNTCIETTTVSTTAEDTTETLSSQFTETSTETTTSTTEDTHLSTTEEIRLSTTEETRLSTTEDTKLSTDDTQVASTTKNTRLSTTQEAQTATSPPTTNTGAIIGGVFALIIIIVVAAVVYYKYKSAKSYNISEKNKVATSQDSKTEATSSEDSKNEVTSSNTTPV